MMQDKLLDIVIVSYAKDDYCKELTKNCLFSLLNSEDNAVDDFNIIVVESEPGVNWDWMAINIKTYEAPIPYGYHKFLNFGRKKGNSQWVALCNNDLEFTKGWFTRILEASSTVPEALSFSPLCPMTQTLYGIK